MIPDDGNRIQNTPGSSEGVRGASPESKPLVHHNTIHVVGNYKRGVSDKAGSGVACLSTLAMFSSSTFDSVPSEA